jgi:hypothetical protein
MGGTREPAWRGPQAEPSRRGEAPLCSRPLRPLPRQTDGRPGCPGPERATGTRGGDPPAQTQDRVRSAGASGNGSGMPPAPLRSGHGHPRRKTKKTAPAHAGTVTDTASSLLQNPAGRARRPQAARPGAAPAAGPRPPTPHPTGHSPSAGPSPRGPGRSHRKAEAVGPRPPQPPSRTVRPPIGSATASRHHPPAWSAMARSRSPPPAAPLPVRRSPPTHPETPTSVPDHLSHTPRPLTGSPRNLDATRFPGDPPPVSMNPPHPPPSPPPEGGRGSVGADTTESPERVGRRGRRGCFAWTTECRDCDGPARPRTVTIVLAENALRSVGIARGLLPWGHCGGSVVVRPLCWDYCRGGIVIDPLCCRYCGGRTRIRCDPASFPIP